MRKRSGIALTYRKRSGIVNGVKCDYIDPDQGLLIAEGFGLTWEASDTNVVNVLEHLFVALLIAIFLMYVILFLCLAKIVCTITSN